LSAETQGGPSGVVAGRAQSTAVNSRKTAVAHFRQQLQSLLTRVAASQSHFVRCINPQPRHCCAAAAADQRADSPSLHPTVPLVLFSVPEVTAQLRYNGIFEALNVARLGYPVRMHHQVFLARYRPLLFRAPVAGPVQALQTLLQQPRNGEAAFVTDPALLKQACDLFRDALDSLTGLS
jgi:hypothetical protein